MKDEHQTLLFGEYYTILSSKTKKPYIDDDNNCYIFDTLIDANKFVSNIKNAEISDLELIKSGLFISKLYSLGIDNIKLKQGVSNSYVTIPVEKEDCKKRYYNRETTRNIVKLKQYSDKSYLRLLKDGTFISPIYIEPRLPQRYGTLKYPFAKTPDSKKYFILFTDLEEFNKWNEDQSQKFKPLEVNLIKEERIRNNNPVIINPLSDKLVLNNAYIKEALSNN